MRSAWIAALLTANGSPSLHEPAVAYGRHMSLDQIFDAGYVGLVYPCAALVYRDQLLKAFDGCRVVVIDRPESESRHELQKWSGLVIGDEGWAKAIETHLWIEDHFPVRRIPFHELDRLEVVDRMVRYLTGRPLDPRIFRLFDSLDIQQHKGKALQRLANVEVPCLR